MCISGCSFFGVQGPIASGSVVPPDPKATCTDSDTLPALDAIGGTAALAVAGGGFIIEQTSDIGDLRNFTKYYAGPLVIAAILYFVSTSVGTNRVERCKSRGLLARRDGDAVDDEPDALAYAQAEAVQLPMSLAEL